MAESLSAGDFLVYQLESAFALLRLLCVDEVGDSNVWHLAAYSDFFPDIESAEAALARPEQLTKMLDHAALTTRAFESTQSARLLNFPLSEADLRPLEDWRESDERRVFDTSIRLLTGFR
ncbi:MAG: hypothetical protein UZ17_ACD001002402 [Acidobacteria bacterium OLB17]|nr:MAG: hypothetical protein UZ17_ACD001002402 [Acidobacteria bacterium OLB17]